MLISDLQLALGTVQSFFPGAPIVLQPLTGGPDEGLCYRKPPNRKLVNASFIHPFAEQAIAAVVDGVSITSGPDPHVSDCTMFGDQTGHLTDAGKVYVGAMLGTYWAGVP